MTDRNHFHLFELERYWHYSHSALAQWTEFKPNYSQLSRFGVVQVGLTRKKKETRSSADWPSQSVRFYYCLLASLLTFFCSNTHERHTRTDRQGLISLSKTTNKNEESAESATGTFFLFLFTLLASSFFHQWTTFGSGGSKRWNCRQRRALVFARLRFAATGGKGMLIIINPLRFSKKVRYCTVRYGTTRHGQASLYRTQQCPRGVIELSSFNVALLDWRRWSISPNI